MQKTAQQLAYEVIIKVAGPAEDQAWLASQKSMYRHLGKRQRRGLPVVDRWRPLENQLGPMPESVAKRVRQDYLSVYPGGTVPTPVHPSYREGTLQRTQLDTAKGKEYAARNARASAERAAQRRADELMNQQVWGNLEQQALDAKKPSSVPTAKGYTPKTEAQRIADLKYDSVYASSKETSRAAKQELATIAQDAKMAPIRAEISAAKARMAKGEASHANLIDDVRGIRETGQADLAASRARTTAATSQADDIARAAGGSVDDVARAAAKSAPRAIGMSGLKKGLLGGGALAAAGLGAYGIHRYMNRD